MIKYFSNEATDTQGVLFEDDSNQELIMAFRGTSSPKDLDTDLVFTLVPLTAPGTKCSDCKVSSSSLNIEPPLTAYRYTKDSKKHMPP